MSILGWNGADPEQDSGLLQPQDSLDQTDGVLDVLDSGWSPPDRPWAVGDWGTTHWEQITGQSLDARLAREWPEYLDEDDGDGLGDSRDTDGELLDAEVGDRRSGRLVDLPWGHPGRDLHARDVGVDGAGASAEEGAVHLVGDDAEAFDRRGEL
ncbi:hypothetical protein LY71_107106 [Geodermatophilus tzadiensis]|uniref:DUF5709 domain-containing protein n=1 Tax=Geodermatophilus tzadiensis TaxID=1137988 RepID=A0A2T0TTK1_9ACTN|nr:DUF5709 domain-containing protein [Geodermatophilus tzadiensis]PRY49024.1 hypothetical protein LY71_107106 [Geodermatophilus tzadiensis]